MNTTNGFGSFIFDIYFETKSLDAAEAARRIGSEPVARTESSTYFCWHPTGKRRGDDETIVWNLSAILGDIWFCIDWSRSSY
ncbi:hypothetical protein L0V05_07715 [Tabrizicola sp. J26]|uniref:hypothetical protein n=1 Tax=Alitabrizicola rongguiensis TaxID=2909234 RepID=UPI001F18B6E4|nr:hypothetical protein [Tabrizicola rongguiensis]MCF1708702.1 hypothetical protein [Tabrizicola rongguiensis]